jgi:hypothetical protein
LSSRQARSRRGRSTGCAPMLAMPRLRLKFQMQHSEPFGHRML